MTNSTEYFRGFSSITLRNNGVFPETKSQPIHYTVSNLLSTCYITIPQIIFLSASSLIFDVHTLKIGIILLLHVPSLQDGGELKQ